MTPATNPTALPPNGTNNTVPRRIRPITGLLIVVLMLLAACAEESAPTTTEPLGVDEILTEVGTKVAAVSTARFVLVDELETGAPFLGTALKRMEAVAETPNNFQMLADVEAPVFGFVQVQIVKVGDQTVMKLYEGAPWSPLSPDQVPFDFEGLGAVFSDLPTKISEAAIAGQEVLDGVQTIRIEGSTSSDHLAPLITSADPGHTVDLTLWVEETTFDLRQVRIAGQLYDDDAPETTRLLTLDDVNQPVDIQLPDNSAGQ